MEINPEIFKILKDHNIGKSAGTLYLLALYYNLDTDELSLSEEVISAINITKIVDRDYDRNTIKWNTSLFYTTEVRNTEQDDWSWLKVWNDRWNVNKDRKGSSSDVLKRMQHFFEKYPHIRKDDVIKATDMYFSRTTPGYLKNSAAFIFDGQGNMKKSILLSWCEKVVDSSNTSNQKGRVVS